MEGKVNMRPLTTRQLQVLRYLNEMDQRDDLYGDLRYPCSPAQIAYGIGMNDLPAVTGGGSGAGRGSGHRVFNPAQRIIGSLTGLRNRGLIGHAARPDGRSGSAYRITDEGRAVLDGT